MDNQPLTPPRDFLDYVSQATQESDNIEQQRTVLRSRNIDIDHIIRTRNRVIVATEEDTRFIRRLKDATDNLPPSRIDAAVEKALRQFEEEVRQSRIDADKKMTKFYMSIDEEHQFELHSFLRSRSLTSSNALIHTILPSLISRRQDVDIHSQPSMSVPDIIVAQDGGIVAAVSSKRSSRTPPRERSQQDKGQSRVSKRSYKKKIVAERPAGVRRSSRLSTK